MICGNPLHGAPWNAKSRLTLVTGVLLRLDVQISPVSLNM